MLLESLIHEIETKTGSADFCLYDHVDSDALFQLIEHDGVEISFAIDDVVVTVRSDGSFDVI